MASSRNSRKPLSGEPLVVGLSGGIDSVVLLHLLKSEGRRVSALHVHHGLSPNAGAWAAFCRRYCRQLKIPLVVRKVDVVKSGEGLEAAARRARYDVFRRIKSDIALAHNLDDQAETVLMNLLRGAGLRGASGMPARSRLGSHTVFRPLLSKPRTWIEDYARRHGLEWIEDESNADDTLTRNFIRLHVGPLLATRFPAWKEAFARAARHFGRKEAGQGELLRAALAKRGLRAPSEARLGEMLKQLAGGGARTRIEHDGALIRRYRNNIMLERNEDSVRFKIEFRPAKGRGISAKSLIGKPFAIRPRAGGERLQPDARRPRRTLKNLFQEAGVPAWKRDSLPLLYSGADLVWVPGIGVDARYQASRGEPGLLPKLLFLRNSRAAHDKLAD